MRNFTKVPNEFWTDGWVQALNGTQIKLVMVLVRLTSGYHQDTVAAGETLLLAESGLDRSGFYKAKKELVDCGLVEVGRKGQKCTYRLRFGEVYPSVNLDGSENPNGYGFPDGYRPEIHTGTGPEIHTGPIIKENRSKKSIKESSSSLAPATSNDDVATPKNELQICPERSDLAGRLRVAGVTDRVAEKLSQESLDVLRRTFAVFDKVKHTLTNPPGWLVSLILDGGPKEVPPAPAAVPELADADQVREAKRQAEERQRQADQARLRIEFDFLCGQAGKAGLEEAYRQARAGLLPALASAPRDHPAVRGAVLEYLRHHYGGRQLVS